jgi:hypothetical protein
VWKGGLHLEQIFGRGVTPSRLQFLAELNKSFSELQTQSDSVSDPETVEVQQEVEAESLSMQDATRDVADNGKYYRPEFSSPEAEGLQAQQELIEADIRAEQESVSNDVSSAVSNGGSDDEIVAFQGAREDPVVWNEAMGSEEPQEPALEDVSADELVAEISRIVESLEALKDAPDVVELDSLDPSAAQQEDSPEQEPLEAFGISPDPLEPSIAQSSDQQQADSPTEQPLQGLAREQAATEHETENEIAGTSSEVADPVDQSAAHWHLDGDSLVTLPDGSSLVMRVQVAPQVDGSTAVVVQMLDPVTGEVVDEAVNQTAPSAHEPVRSAAMEAVEDKSGARESIAHAAMEGAGQQEDGPTAGTIEY